jgi:glycosyltransferase involved in cell wall biosynthesis
VGEGFGLAAAEALMCGVPVIACEDGGGLLDIVPPDGPGRVVAPEPEALADATAAILADPAAPAAARELGSEWRRRLDPSAVAARFHDWYREAARV